MNELRIFEFIGRGVRRRPLPRLGSLAGYLKSPYQANFAGVRRRPEGSEMMKQVV